MEKMILCDTNVSYTSEGLLLRASAKDTSDESWNISTLIGGVRLRLLRCVVLTEIDILVYKLYLLTHAEVLLWNPDFGLGEAAYDEIEAV